MYMYFLRENLGESQTKLNDADSFRVNVAATQVKITTISFVFGKEYFTMIFEFFQCVVSWRSVLLYELSWALRIQQYCEKFKYFNSFFISLHTYVCTYKLPSLMILLRFMNVLKSGDLNARMSCHFQLLLIYIHLYYYYIKTILRILKTSFA